MMSGFFTLFWLSLCVMAAGLVREYTFYTSSKGSSWSEAQQLCRINYVDLATITTEEENQRVMEASQESYFFRYYWIGLYGTLTGSGSWLWSDGELPNYFDWGSKEPNNPRQDENCVAISSSGWIPTNCSNDYSFSCYRRLILVQENKTWEEALQYCRTHHTDLYCPISDTKLNLVDLESTEAQSVSVWTGLRFLDGEWFWLNKWRVQSLELLQACPAQQYRCGARSTDTHEWENRDCNEKLNFICYLS